MVLAFGALVRSVSIERATARAAPSGVAKAAGAGVERLIPLEQHEKAVAVDRQIEITVGLAQLASLEVAQDIPERNTLATAPAATGQRRTACLFVADHITETDSRALEPGGVQIGDVVADLLQAALIGVEAAEADIDRAKHVIPFLLARRWTAPRC